jgi:hypothetical protein
MTVNDTVQWGGNVGEVGDCSLLLGGSELALNEAPLIVHPNPATERISISSLGEGRMDAEVVGPDGRVVMAMPLTGTELPITALPAGAYVLKVRGTAGAVRMARFVKH